MSTVEGARVIADSETSVAQEEKRMVRNLVGKGWTHNEVIFEM